MMLSFSVAPKKFITRLVHSLVGLVCWLPLHNRFQFRPVFDCSLLVSTDLYIDSDAGRNIYIYGFFTQMMCV